MPTAKTDWLLFGNPEHYDLLREALIRANYTVPGVLEVMGSKNGTVSTTDIPLMLERTLQGRPVDTLMRLFLAKAPVAPEALREAIAPLDLETFESAGLIKTQDKAVIAGLKLVPFDRFYVAQEIYDPAFRPPGDFVIGVGPATLMLSNCMIRRRSRLVLDLGTGTGLLALIKSGESDKVIATDTNARAVRMAAFNARLNRFSNIECREGDMFEPVAGSKFDIILSNAPFVISPSSGYLYLDGGMQGGQFCERLARSAPEFLAEGGYCQFLCDWAHVKGQDWQERFAGWFKGTGCDTWVLRGPTEDIRAYARKWIRHFESKDEIEFGHLYEEWMKYYSREGIEAVTTGFVTMRRNSTRENWFRVVGQPELENRDLGEPIIRMFELEDFLGTVRSDDSLMRAVLMPAADVRLDVQYTPGDGGWQPKGHQLKMTKGLGFSAQTDQLACDFIMRCDGRRTVAEALAEVAPGAGMSMNELVSGCLHIIRHLIQLGFMIPVELSAVAGSATVSRS